MRSVVHCLRVCALIKADNQPRSGDEVAEQESSHNMAANNAASSAENTVPAGDPNLIVQAQIVKEDVGKQEQLYISPVLTQNTQQGAINSTSPSDTVVVNNTNTAATQAKKVDPRQEWINSDNTKPYFCKLCDFNMDCMEAFQLHCMSARHIKRSIEEFNIKLPKRLEEKDEKKALPQYNCQVCLVTCNSDCAWNAHLLGQKHRKALEKQGAERAQQKAQEKGMMNTMNTGYGRGGRGGGGFGPVRGGSYTPGHSRKPYDKPVHAVQQPSLSGPIGAKDFATYPEPLIGLEYVTEIQVIGQSPRYHCELCDSKFDHNLKFPHLVGSKHRFNVLKEKVPDVAQSIRGDVKKRSELSSKLLEEAHKLEMNVGRQQVKTRVEKSPFNRINNQATGQSSVQQTARGGGQQWQSQRGRGQGGARGGRGGTYGGQGGSYSSGGRGGTSSGQGGSYGSGGHGGTSGGQRGSYSSGQGTRGGRGRQQGSYQQQSVSSRGGRGRGRGSTSTNNQNQSWSNNKNYTPYNSAPNQTFPAGSYSSGDNNSQWNSGGQGGGDRMLPVEAFKPRSPPRISPYSNNYQDNYYDDYYGGNQNTAASYSDSNYEYNNAYSSQTTSEQTFHSYGQTPSASSGSLSNSGMGGSGMGGGGMNNSGMGDSGMGGGGMNNSGMGGSGMGGGGMNNSGMGSSSMGGGGMNNSGMGGSGMSGGGISNSGMGGSGMSGGGMSNSGMGGSGMSGGGMSNNGMGNSVGGHDMSGGGGGGNSSVSLLQGAIADLGKLVSTEEDASMALQVSNALTQALLQFRMNNLPQESLGDNSTAAGGVTPMNSET